MRIALLTRRRTDQSLLAVRQEAGGSKHLRKTAQFPSADDHNDSDLGCRTEYGTAYPSDCQVVLSEVGIVQHSLRANYRLQRRGEIS